MNEPSLNFNWPENQNEMYKAFLTNLASDHEYDRILNNLINMSESDWGNIVLQSRESVMAYDPGNTKFVDLMKKLLTSNKKKYKR